MPNVTIFSRSYPPAYLRGGPARSVHALVELLSAMIRFSVITSATDDPATGPMRSVEVAQWTTFGRARVWYETRKLLTIRAVAALLDETEPQLIYLNSLFDFRFSILPLLTLRATANRTPVLLAPRGELAPGALALKKMKKRAFIHAFRILRLHHAVTWHVSTDQEKADVERVFGSGTTIFTAIDLRIGLHKNRAPEKKSSSTTSYGRPGSLIFFSRIVPKKNLSTAIKAITMTKAEVRLSIAGPIEDARYWDQCLQLTKRMRLDGLVRYVGTIPADEAVSFLQRFDLFVFPTLGENFGHVILESLAAGTPVIVGSGTPWHHVETSGAGWVCDPTDPQMIAEKIDTFFALDQEARTCMRQAARNLACEILDDRRSVDANLSMFQELASRDRTW